MNILVLLNLLVSSNWSSTCIMTQSDDLQGYTIDTTTFSKAEELNVSITRTWYQDQNCTHPIGNKSYTQGTVTLGEAIQTSSFPSSTSEYVFAADWKLGTTATQLGAIAISSDGKSIRTATTSFGNQRNTMLSLFRYFAK